MGKLQCVKKCLAGQKWNIGDITTEAYLRSQGVPEIPSSFVPYEQAVNELVVDADSNGFTTKREMLNYLLAKGVTVPERTRKDDLQKLIDGLMKEES